MIVVFGSINVDLVFPLERLPRAGETILGERYFISAGGKGANQAVAAARDGAHVRMVGAVGDDGFAAIGLAELTQAGVDLGRVAKVAAPTGCAGIFVDRNGRNQIAVAAGANAQVAAAQLPDDWLQSGATLLCQMELRETETAAAIHRAKTRGARVILNLAPAADLGPESLEQVDILVVNETEAEQLGKHLGVAGSAPALAEELSGVTVIETRGANGAVAVRDGRHWTAKALPVTAVDTVGAGDCFVGVLAAALDAGAALDAALRRACVAGSLACTKPGAQPSLPTAAEIDAALRV
jgi:ribokinase